MSSDSDKYSVTPGAQLMNVGLSLGVYVGACLFAHVTDKCTGKGTYSDVLNLLAKKKKFTDALGFKLVSTLSLVLDAYFLRLYIWRLSMFLMDANPKKVLKIIETQEFYIMFFFLAIFIIRGLTLPTGSRLQVIIP